MIFVLRNSFALTLATIAFGLLLGAERSAAFEELKVFRGVLVLEGKIGPGDYDKLRKFLGQKSNFDKISGGVFLASPGGSITQAMKMGRLIHNLRLATDAPSGPQTGIPKFGQSVITPGNLKDPKANYLCASACFFVYVGGVYRNLNWVGRLGVHQPIQLESNAKKLTVDETLNLNWEVRTIVKNYLKDMDVPEKYVDIIYSTPPNEVRWISQNEFDADFGGFIPEMKNLLKSKCGVQSTIQPGEINRCWMRMKADLSNEAWNKEFSAR